MNTPIFDYSNLNIDNTADVITASSYCLNDVSRNLMTAISRDLSIFSSMLSILAGINHIRTAESAKRKKKTKQALGALEATFAIPTLISNVATVSMVASGLSSLILSWGIVAKTAFDAWQVKKKLNVEYLIEDRLIKHSNLETKIIALNPQLDALKQELKILNQKLKNNKCLTIEHKIQQEIDRELKKRIIQKIKGYEQEKNKYGQAQKVVLNQATSLFRVERAEKYSDKSKPLSELMQKNLNYLQDRVDLNNSYAHDKKLHTHLINKQQAKYNECLERCALSTVAAVGMTCLILSPFLPAAVGGLGVVMVTLAGITASAYLLSKLIINPLKAHYYKAEYQTNTQAISTKSISKINIDKAIVRKNLGLNTDAPDIDDLVSGKDQSAIIEKEAAKHVSLVDVTKNIASKVGLFAHSVFKQLITTKNEVTVQAPAHLIHHTAPCA